MKPKKNNKKSSKMKVTGTFIENEKGELVDVQVNLEDLEDKPVETVDNDNIYGELEGEEDV